VEQVSEAVAHYGGNWQESRMASLAGQFAGILLISVSSAKSEAARIALEELATEGLKVTVESSLDAEKREPCHAVTLELVGQDHPGIVHDISAVLVGHGISVDELQTECRSASMSGETLFHASARLLVPKRLSTDELSDILESLANELMVDINLDDASG
jgi:glycine cleavage system regulatory protein